MNNSQSSDKSSYSTYFPGSGEMRDAILSFNWAATPLGVPDAWPQSLFITLGIMLHSHFPMFLFWGDNCTQFYNDAYRVSLGNQGMHPSALGASGRDTWGERWPVIQSRIEHVITTGEPIWNENEPVVFFRNNKHEVTYWTYAYSKVKDETGQASGVFIVCHETTTEVKNMNHIQQLNEELTVNNEELVEAQTNLQTMIAELTENEARFRMMVEQMPAAISVFGTRDLLVKFANDKMLEIWGRTALEVINRPLLDAMPELSGQPFMKMLDQVFTTGIAYHSRDERAFIQRNGDIQEGYFNIVYQPIVDADGSVNSLLQVATEVTKDILTERQIQNLNEELTASNEELYSANEELAATNEELAVSNEELRLLFEEMRTIQENLVETNRQLADSEEKLRLSNEAAGIGNWSMDGKTGAITGTQRYRTIFGFDDNEAIDITKVAALVPESHLQNARRMAEAAIPEGKAYVNEFPFRRKHDGALRWARTIGTPKLDESKQMIVFTGVTMDITDQVMAKKEIEESEERFRTMAEGTNILIAVADESSNATYFNKAWEDVTGRSREELLNFGWLDLVHTEDKDRYLNIYLSAFEKRTSFTGEMRVQNSEGSYLWLLAQGSPRFRADGSFAGYISSCIDITEQKRDDERKNDFISMVSHELKTPLTSMSGYISILAFDAKDKDRRTAGLLEKAGRQVSKMTTMINGFLNVSRLESGKLQIDKTRFDMADLILEYKDESLSTINSHDLIFHHVEETIVEADRDKLGHVIHNFISNAVKYSPPGSLIEIACITQNGRAQVSVKDEGIGIAPEDQEKLFERYYRVKNNYTDAIAGFGIGLYLCAEIIQRNNGDLWIESEPGKGSTFYFSLPLAK